MLRYCLAILSTICLISCDGNNQKSPDGLPSTEPTQTALSPAEQQEEANEEVDNPEWELSHSVDPLDDSQKDTARGSFFDTDSGPYMAHVEFSCFEHDGQSRFEITIAFTDFNGIAKKLQAPQGEAQVDVRVGKNKPSSYEYSVGTKIMGNFLPFGNTVQTIIQRGRYIPFYFQGIQIADKVVLKPYLFEKSPTFVMNLDNDAKSVINRCHYQFESPLNNPPAKSAADTSVDVKVISAE